MSRDEVTLTDLPKKPVPAAGSGGKSSKIALVRSLLKEGPTANAGAARPDTGLPPLLAPRCALAAKAACCGGKGYVVTAKGGRAHADICKCVGTCPACFGQARIVEGNDSRSCRTPSPTVVANLINGAMIPARYADASIENFQNFSGNGKAVLGELARWKAGFKPVKGRGVILTGRIGVGKTYLLAAIAKDMAERGLTVRFTDFFHLLGELRAGFSEGKADAAQLGPLIDVDVLLIDELGKGRNNEFELTVLDQLVCGRYNQNKTIIASTNYQLKPPATMRVGYSEAIDRGAGGGQGDFGNERFDSLETRIGPRIFSRLVEMAGTIELSGEDYRRPDSV